jgi:HK97 family phage portal protein
MSWLTQALNNWRPAAGGARRFTGSAQPEEWLLDAWRGPQSRSGVTVSEQAALGHPAVYAAVRVLSESLAQLPTKVYRYRADGGKDEDRQHALWVLLHDSPNPEMTAFEFKACLMGHLALWGNAYAEVERDGLGRVVNLWPLRPDRMTVTRDDAGRRVWVYTLPTGAPAKFTWKNPSYQAPPILHLRGLSADGHLGYSPLQLLRESIGLSLAAEQYGARIFGSAGSVRGALKTEQRLTDDVAKRIKESWEASHKGLTNAHRVAVLEQGVSWQQIGVSPEDAQMLQTRKFQVNEIARAFRVPPHMIGDLERATFSNIEHQSIDFVTHTLMPWVVAWEQAIARDLLSIRSFRTHTVKFVVNGLLRGDVKSRFEAYAIGIQHGWYSPDDVRGFEDLNPLPDGVGDTYLRPLNMVPAGQAPASAPTTTRPTEVAA